MFKKITLTGPFTVEDIDLLAKTVRQCEQKQPDKPFTMELETTESLTVEAAKEFLISHHPVISKHVKTEIEICTVRGNEN